MNQLKNLTTPRSMLRLEGTIILVVAAVAYFSLGYSLWVFALLLLWPDIAIVVYALNKQAGILAYNFLHTLIFPVALLGLALLFSWELALPFALIWLAHIGMDRLFGYGLKYSGQFKETHLSRV